MTTHVIDVQDEVQKLADANEEEIQDAEIEVTFKFPCLLTVERKHPIHRGRYNESDFTVELEDTSDVYFDGDLLHIEYIDDKQKVERHILRENINDWRVRHYGVKAQVEPKEEIVG